VPNGTYDVGLNILADGVAVAHTKSTFNAEKVGAAQFVARSSVDHSLIYGIAAMGMA
jgi:Putative transmembrane protein (Alph_Pro_TM)